MARPPTPTYASAESLAASQRAFERMEYVLGPKALPQDMPRPVTRGRRRRLAREAEQMRRKEDANLEVNRPEPLYLPEGAARGDAPTPTRVAETNVKNKGFQKKFSDDVPPLASHPEGKVPLESWEAQWNAHNQVLAGDDGSGFGGPVRQAEAQDSRTDQQRELAQRQADFQRSYAERIDSAAARKSVQAARKRIANESRHSEPDNHQPVPPSSAGPQDDEQAMLLALQKNAYRKQRAAEAAALAAQEALTQYQQRRQPAKKAAPAAPAAAAVANTTAAAAPRTQKAALAAAPAPPLSPPPPARDDSLVQPSRSPLRKALAWSEEHDVPPPAAPQPPLKQTARPYAHPYPADEALDIDDDATHGYLTGGVTEPSPAITADLNSPFRGLSNRRKTYHGGTLQSHIEHAEHTDAIASDRLESLHQLITSKLAAKKGDAKVWLRAALRPPGANGREAGGTPAARVADALRLLNVVPSPEEMDLLVAAHQVPGSDPPLVSVSSLAAAIEPHLYGGGLGVEDSYSGARMDVLLEEDLPRIQGIFDRAAHKSEATRRAAAPQLALAAVREAAHGRRCGAAALRTLLRQLAGAGEVGAAQVRALLERSAAAALHPADAEACVLPFMTSGGRVDCSALARAVLGNEDLELPWQRAEEAPPPMPPPEQAGASLPDLLPTALARVIRERVERHRRVPRDLSSRLWAKSLLGKGEKLASVADICARLRVPPLTLAVPLASLERLLAPYRAHHAPAHLVDVARFVDDCLFPEEGYLEQPGGAGAPPPPPSRPRRPSSAPRARAGLFAQFDASHGAVAPRGSRAAGPPGRAPPPPWGDYPKPVWSTAT